MTNNLKDLKKELKSFAKRVKDFKYTDSALITFLLTGMIGIGEVSTNLFSKENEIEAQTKAINTSIFDLKKDFKRARQENDKLLRNTNLELIQLMEQGDHVTKSPWSSWQYGANSFYNDWQGRYKGRGDKVKDVKYTRSTGMDKYQYKKRGQVTYGGSTEISFPIEPNAAIPIAAALKPIQPLAKNANLALKVDISNLPQFKPRTVNDPVEPSAPVLPTPGSFNFSLTGVSNGNGGRTIAFKKTNSNGAIESVISSGGNFNIVRQSNGTMKYSFRKYSGTSPWGTPEGSITTTSWNNVDDDGTTTSFLGFQKLVGDDSGYAMGLTNTNNLLTNVNNFTSGTTPVIREFVHLDHHSHVAAGGAIAGLTSGTTDPNWDSTVSSGSNKTAVLAAYNDVVNNVNATTLQNSKNSSTASKTSDLFFWMNSGRIVMEGKNNVVTNNYDHNGTRNSKSVAANIGDIKIQPYHDNNGYFETSNAVFSLSDGVNGSFSTANNAVRPNGHLAIVYNGSTGNIDLWTSDSAYFLDADGERAMSIINRGSVNVYGQGSVGTYFVKNFKKSIDLQFVSSDFTFDNTKNAVTNGSFKPMTIYGDNSVGYFQNQVKTTTEGNFAVNIGSSGVGNQSFTTNKTSKITTVTGGETNGDLITNRSVNVTDDAANAKNNPDYIRNSFGILSSSPMTLTSHQIKIYDKTENNVGVMPNANVALDLGGGSITLEGGNTSKNNVGIYIGSNGGSVKSTGVIDVNNGIGNLAIAAIKNSGATDVEVNKVNATGTKNSVLIYASNSAKVKADELNVSGATVENDANTTNKKNSGAVYATTGAKVTINRAGTAAPATPNIEITGTEFTDQKGTYTGFGLYSNKATIDAQKNNIKVSNAGAAIVSIDGSSTIDLTDSKVEYNGPGYAFFSKNNGNINFTSGTLTLRGNATGYSLPVSGGSPITLTNATINAFSNDVIVMNLKGVTTYNTSGSKVNGTPLTSFLPTNPINYTEGSTTYNGFKYTVLDDVDVNIDSAIDKSNSTSTSDDYIFSRRVLFQNSRLNAQANVSANLNTKQLSEIDSSLNMPVGLAISASSKSTKTSTTGITVSNGVTIESDRTDAGAGAVGLYANYGFINNDGNINVEQGTGATPNAANDNAVGIYATNSTAVNNQANGNIKVDGKKSIGILGLSYRLDDSGNPVTNAEPFANNPLTDTTGIVNIVNNGNIEMNVNDAATSSGTLGIYIKNNSLGTGAYQRTVAQTTATNNKTITMHGGDNAIAMAASNGTLTNAATGTINIENSKSAGMFGEESSILNNAGTINVAVTTPAPVGSESIGMFTQDVNTPITTSGTINVGKNSYGIYGRNVNMNGGTISVDDNGLGIYSTGPNVALNSGTINVANNNAVGVYVQDDKASPTPINITGNVNMNVGSNQSFGYSLITTKPVNLTTGAGTTATVGDKSVYIYSASPIQAGSLITNNSTVTTTGNNGYAIYSLQDAVNNGTLNLGSGVGNIGLYSTGGTITNTGAINVGPSNTMTKEFGIGMATGYYNDTTTPPSISNEGTIVNKGVINVTTPNSIGMYAVGSGSKAINETTGLINLSGPNTIGMYIDQGATGINYGTIKTVATGAKMKGVVLANGGILKNYGNIEITGPDTMGVYSDGTGVVTMPYAEDTDSTRGVTGHNNSDKAVYIASATDEKPEGSVIIKTPPKANPQSVMVRKPDGTLESVAIENVDTNKATPDATVVEVRAGDSTLLNDPFKTFDLNTFSQKGQTGEITSLAMYIDTSGINFTHPIQGLHYLSGLTDINLIVGTEATQYSNAKAIEIGDNILKPYNDALTGITGTLNVNSSSLTWLAQPVRNAAGNAIDRVYLVKVPYTDFASEKDPDTKNFLDGLEQRYGVDDYGDRGERERIVFNKLNDIGKGETHIFAQAVNEMKGYQYSNTQQRINETGSLLDKEFTYLHDQWRNPSKQNNKIKVFGMRNEYNTDTAGVIDNVSNSYGVAYVHEDEAVTMGNSQGWYAGAVNNYYKFKDLGGSRENQTMIKAGIFKTMSPAGDHNGNLRWTIAGDVFAGKNEMKRRFWVVDDTFSAKSDYYSYGAALKTDIGYDIRTSERTHIRPYGALKLEYGRFTDIKEKDGEIRLKVDGNDYVSVKPEAGVEFKYVQPLAVRTNLSVGLTAAYTNELGKINELNKAKVRYTTADWYNLKNEKEDRRGSGKFDLNVGVDNTRFGVTANLGYDTKGENIRGGLGFRLIY